MAVDRIGDDRAAPLGAATMWRTAGHRLFASRCKARLRTAEKARPGRCSKTIEGVMAAPVLEANGFRERRQYIGTGGGDGNRVTALPASLGYPILQAASTTDTLAPRATALFLLALHLCRKQLIVNSLPAQQSRVLQRLDIRQIAQRLHAEGGEEFFRRHIGVRRPGCRAARS